MIQLQETHDAIPDSPENLLPLGAILRTVGALLLSTATVLVTAFAQEWIAGLVERFVPGWTSFSRNAANGSPQRVPQLPHNTPLNTSLWPTSLPTL